MQDYLVDVPVCIYIWIRKECQRKQFEIIKQSKTKYHFLVSDGGRNDEETRIISNHRKM